MSFSADMILSVMRAVKGTGLIKGPDTDVDANLRKAREYNRRHLYKEPADRKAAYKTIYAGGYPCLVIRQRHTPPSGKAILYYSTHHGNTKKLLDAITAENEVELIDVTKAGDQNFSGYDRIGLASSIYYSNYAKPFLAYAERNLPEGKPGFFIYTHGAPKGDFLKGIREITQKKNCPELGAYHCTGFDTFGPFKVVGGIAKGHPTEAEVKAAVDFYKGLPEK